MHNTQAPMGPPTTTWMEALGSIRGLHHTYFPSDPFELKRERKAKARVINCIRDPLAEAPERAFKDVDPTEDTDDASSCSSCTSCCTEYFDAPDDDFDEEKAVPTEDSFLDPLKEPIDFTFETDEPSLSPTEGSDDDWLDFGVMHNLSGQVPQAFDTLDEFHSTLSEGNTSAFVSSCAFGPTSLLATATDTYQAVVDTGSSCCMSPHKEDFYGLQTCASQVVQGINVGSKIQGYGMVNWQVDVGSTTIPIMVRGACVPGIKKDCCAPNN